MTAGVAAWLRRHALFLGALAVGAGLRVIVTYAYQPALIFPDSMGYLGRADPFRIYNERPSGYSVFLRPFVEVTSSMQPIAVVQHLMGLALAVLCYAFVVRRGLPRWAATLVALPLLLDPLQLVLEQYVLSDVLFECLVVGACLLLLWRRRPGLGAVLLAGALIGSAGVVRGAGTFLLVVFAVALLCLRVHWVKLVAFGLAALLPLSAYAVQFHRQFHVYAVSTAGPRFLYARIAPIARCHDPQLHLPSYERMLCPHMPVAKRPSTDYYMWGHKRGPAWRVVGPPDMTQEQVLKDFDKRVIRAEPVVYGKAALADTARGFAPVRTVQVPGYPASYWLFADHYWSVDTFIKRHVFRPKIRNGTAYSPTAARFLTGYREWVYTPGPLLAALLVLAGAAILGLGRSRRSRRQGDRVAIGLLTCACVVPLLTASFLSGFSWRYQLPQIPLLPMAGALGLAALLRGPRPGAPAAPPPLRVLDRSANLLVRLPQPARVRTALLAAADRGSLQRGIAVVAGAAAGAVSAALAVASGWAAPPLASVGGTAVAVAVLVTLIVARARALSGSPEPAGPDPDVDGDQPTAKVPSSR